MAERKWTEAQLDAIYKDGKSILVSAAAGSGKTAVLTKRVIEKLTDSEKPADISRMLIVTFTKAAANELKERIGKAISEVMAKNPSDKRLARQYVLLQKAKISTIHGFCLDVIKQNFDKLGLSPSVSVSDSAESTLIMEQVADIVIDSYYASAPGYTDINDFADFADNFVTLSDAMLSELLITVYNKVSSYPRGVEFVLDSARELKKASELGFFDSALGETVITHISDTFEYYSAVFKEACDYLDDGDVFSKSYLPSFEYEYKFTSDALVCLKAHDIKGFTKMLLMHSGIGLKPLKGDNKTEKTEFYKTTKAAFSSELRNIAENFFSESDDVIKSCAEKSYDFVNKLYLFLSAFDRKYTEEKRKRELLDYTDLERLAFTLLVDGNGEATDTAKNLSLHFDEIYIDEYQDVNSIQDRMFKAVAVSSSRFMVGDIKQSIYGFRGAEPSVFAGYRLDDTTDKIYLSHNFRCDSPIIDFVNLVCGSLFKASAGTVPYDEADDLLCGKDNSGNGDVEVHLIATGKANVAERRACEAKFVAERVSRFLSEGYQKKDICILVRSTKRSADPYVKALSELDIPCTNQLVKDLFANPEVLLVMNILNVIDNPSRDIPLAGALKSPIFNFTLSELVTIRRYSRDGSLFDALRKYTADTDFEKGRYFLSKLEKYRSDAQKPIDELIWNIYRDTHIIALASGGGRASSVSDKKANLLMLYELARKFETGSFKGLYNFIGYINNLLDSKAIVKEASSSADAEDSVKIMTVHHSKGLEFPVVILSDCDSDFSRTDLNTNVYIDKDLGITLKLSDDSGLASYDTVLRRAHKLGLINSSRDEEMRVLYVALTRAVNKLIVTASSSLPEALTEKFSTLSHYSTYGRGYAYKNCTSYIDWILMATAGRYTPEIHPLTVSGEEADESVTDNTTVTPEEQFPDNDIKALEAEYRSRFDFKYSGHGINIPAKLSVSKLYPEVLDEYDEALDISSDNISTMKKPKFAEASTASGADRGTATHQFMQFCDFSELSCKGVDSEISRLLSCGFIDSTTSELIDRSTVERFLKTELFSELLSAKFIKRELRFNIGLPASHFTSDGNAKKLLANDVLLVQGIMDCVFLDSQGKLTVLDYKTDRIPRDFMDTEGAPEKYLIEKHIQQLSYYKLACEKMMCKRVDRVILYSFALSKTIEVECKELI